MKTDQIDQQLRRLLIGLADQEIKDGHIFAYDGGQLHADDVGMLALPSVLCIAQDLSERVAFGSLGYRFEFGSPNPVFPLHAIPDGQENSFNRVAPFVAEVFSGEVMECRNDLALLFATAARLVDPHFDLTANTNYVVQNAPTGPVATPAALER